MLKTCLGATLGLVMFVGPAAADRAATSCSVTVRNASSPVPVKKVSVTFRFSDGTSSTKSSGSVNLGPGKAFSVNTNPGDRAKCVKHTTTIITVGSKPISKTDGATQCQRRLGWRVDATGIASLRPRFELPESEWHRMIDKIDAVLDENVESPPD